MVKRAKFAGTYNYELAREGVVWTYDGSQVDFEKVQNLLKPLANLKASNFSSADLDESHPLYQSISLELESGEIVNLNFYLKDDKASTLLLQTSTKPKLFEYSKSGLNRFKTTVDDLLPDPLPEAVNS